MGHLARRRPSTVDRPAAMDGWSAPDRERWSIRYDPSSGYSLGVPDPSEPGSPLGLNRQAFRRYLFILVAPVAGILLAWAVGVPPRRLRPAVAFQGIALAAALYFFAALKMQRRTGRRQQRLESLVGIRFRTPIWMMLIECAIAIEIGGALAAVVATFGLVGVANGLFLTFALLGLCMPWFKIGMQPRWIVLEPDGIRMAVSRATFLVPWTTVGRIEPIGPDHFRGLNIILEDSESVLESVRPDDSKARERIRTLIQSSPGIGAALLLMPWAAGLEGRTLERGIREGMSGKVSGMN
jgi:hypothetical protein